MPGPVPKRNAERRRRNKESKADVLAPKVPAVKVPGLPRATHPVARAWYRSLKDSGQSALYEPSDWQAARLVATEMTRLLQKRFSAEGFSAIWSAMTDLMTTETARRRARVEVERHFEAPTDDPGVTAISDYRSRIR